MKTRYRFTGRGGDTYYWESELRVPGDSRVEQIACSVGYFWSRPLVMATPSTQLGILLDMHWYRQEWVNDHCPIRRH